MSPFFIYEYLYNMKKVLFEDTVASEVDGVVVKKKIWTFYL